MIEPVRKVLDYVRSSYGKNIDLRPFLQPFLSGVVLHDDREALDRAQGKLKERRDVWVYETDAAKRFKGWVVNIKCDVDWKRVVLQETGMGSMNASIVVHELAAGLMDKVEEDAARHIIKIGTCGGLYLDQRAGSILVPDYALDDEGATRWNKDTRSVEEVEGVLFHSEPIKPYGNLTSLWRERLENLRDPLISIDGVKDTRRPAAVWTIDTFYPRRWISDKIFELIDNHKNNNSDSFIIRGIENECSSHFSACQHLHLPIAAAVVVSWTRGHVAKLRNDGNPERSEEEKKLVHAIETRLIVEAVDYLAAGSDNYRPHPT
jgi:uridine phosphorylase